MFLLRRVLVIAVLTCFTFVIAGCSASELDAATPKCDSRCQAEVQWFWATELTLSRMWMGTLIANSPHAQCVANHESRGYAEAQNPVSTASGLYGFLDTTWQNVSNARGRPDLPPKAREATWYEQALNFQWLADRAGDTPWMNRC